MSSHSVNVSYTWQLASALTLLQDSRNSQQMPVGKLLDFLSRVSTLTRDIDITILSVRLSVRFVPVFYGNGLRYWYSSFTAR